MIAERINYEIALTYFQAYAPHSFLPLSHKLPHSVSCVQRRVVLAVVCIGLLGLFSQRDRRGLAITTRFLGMLLLKKAGNVSAHYGKTAGSWTCMGQG